MNRVFRLCHDDLIFAVANKQTRSHPAIKSSAFARVFFLQQALTSVIRAINHRPGRRRARILNHSKTAAQPGAPGSLKHVLK